MCISEKRGRHSQSYVEVILSIENVPKMYQKCVPDGRLQAKDRCTPHTDCFDFKCGRVPDSSGEP